MGWRGALRSIEAAARASAREADRRRKIALKAQLAASAAEAVSAWEDHLDSLTHVHGKLNQGIDWKELANQAAPAVPHLLSTHTDAARRELEVFRPRFFDFLIGGSEKRRQRLQASLDRAPDQDAAEFAAARTIYEREHTEWLSDVETAVRVLRHDPRALKSVIEEGHPFTDDGFIGSSIAFSFADDFVHAVVNVLGTDIVPATQLKQTATGKLSETKMPISKFNELYQDYVATVPLRVARIAFNVLPISELYVTCRGMMLNAQTGHQELTPILSVQVVRETLAQLDLAYLDASEALANFNHTMSFKKATGFQKIESLKPIR
jgi:hypothetical protein